MADLERRLSGARVTWVDRAGSHVGSWKDFNHFIFSQYGPYGERPEVCNLLEFNMDQLDGLNNAQQMALAYSFTVSAFLLWSFWTTYAWPPRPCKIGGRRSMTVSERIIQDYLSKGLTMADVPRELKYRLNDRGEMRIYRYLVERGDIKENPRSRRRNPKSRRRGPLNNRKEYKIT